MAKVLYGLKVSQGSQGLKGLCDRDTLNKVQAAYREGIAFMLRMPTLRGYNVVTFTPTIGGLLMEVGLAKDSAGTVHEAIPANADGTLWNGEGEPVMKDPEEFPRLLMDFNVTPWAARSIRAAGENASAEAQQLVGGKVPDGAAPEDPAAAKPIPAADLP